MAKSSPRQRTEKKRTHSISVTTDDDTTVAKRQVNWARRQPAFWAAVTLASLDLHEIKLSTVPDFKCTLETSAFAQVMFDPLKFAAGELLDVWTRPKLMTAIREHEWEAVAGVLEYDNGVITTMDCCGFDFRSTVIKSILVALQIN